MNNLTKTLQDIYEGAKKIDLWGHLGYLEVRRRYRRTVLGPFWATLNMGIFVLTLGTLFAALWGMKIESYLPYLVSGFIAWTPISAIISESGNTFIAAESILKQLKIPHSVFIYATVWRNILVLAHHMVIYLIILVIFPVDIGWGTLLFLPGLGLLGINLTWMSLLISIICTRFRDVQQLLNNFLQILMFVTPIFWPVSQLQGTRAWIADLNPVYHLIQLLREPLLGKIPAMTHWYVGIGLAIVGWTITIATFSRIRGRISLWL